MLAVHGQKLPAQRRARSMTSSPPATSASLLARSTRSQQESAVHTLLRPAMPTTAQSAVVRAGHFERLRRAVRPEHPLAEAHVLRERLRLHFQRRHAGTESPHEFKQFFRRRTGRQADGLKTLRVAAHDVQRLRADGACRAQYGDLSLQIHHPITRKNMWQASVAKSMPSSRSMTPPCPGNIFPKSLMRNRA